MAKRVLILTGAPGVGKSTVGRHWAIRHGGAAIEADQIRLWITDKQLRRGHGYQEAALAETCTAAALQFLHQSLDVVIANVWTPAGVKILEQNLEKKAKVCCVWLTCELKENQRRDQLRPAENQMGRRVDEVAAELGSYHWPAGVIQMDTSLDLVEQTYERLESLF